MRPVSYVRVCTGYRPSDSVRRSLGPFRSTGCATDTRFDIHVEPEIRRAQAFSRPMATEQRQQATSVTSSPVMSRPDRTQYIPLPLANLTKLYGTFWPTNNRSVSTVANAATSATP